MFESRIDRCFRRYCRTGDPAPLGQVFDLAAKELLRVAAYLCGNRADAEDVLQRTFLAVIESRGRFDRRQRVLPWLCGIAANLSRSVVRERRRRERAVASPGVERDAAAVAAERELAAYVAGLRTELGPQYGDVLELHLEQGMNAKEIAARLGRPAGTVRTQLVRALKLLRQRLPNGYVAAWAPCAPLEVLGAVRAKVLAAAQAAAPVAAPAVGAIATLGGVLMGKALYLAAPVAAVALGFAIHAAWPSPAQPSADAARAPHVATASAGERAAPAARTDRVAVDDPSLRVLDARTLQPVADARLLAVDVHSRFFQPERMQVLAAAAADGTLAERAARPATGVLVFAPGYVPAPPPLQKLGVGELRLQPGASLTVRAVDEDDMPVADVDLLLTLPGARAVEPRPPGDRIGNPSHAEPVWTARTDAQGLATFAGLPDAEFRLRAWHATLCPLTEAGLGVTPLRAPAGIELRLGRLYGLCARLPDRPAMRHVQWHVAPRLIDITMVGQARRHEASKALQQRFPGCCVFTCRPSAVLAGEEWRPWFRCRGIGEDGSVWEAKASLQPLDEVEPVPLVLQPGTQCGLVQIDVVDAQGTAVAVPLVLLDQADKTRQDVGSGAAEWLPFGTYRIAFQFGPWFARVPEADLQLQVGDDRPVAGHHTVHVPMPLAKLVVAVSLPGGDERPAILHIGVDGRDYDMFGMTNLDARGGPWTLWVPYGEFDVGVESSRFQRLQRHVVIDRPEVRVDCTLQPRQPSADGRSTPHPDVPGRSR